MLDYIAALCMKRGYSFVRLDGSVKASQRPKIINSFTDPDSKICML